MHIKQADEPSNINFDNLEVTYSERIVRRSISVLLALITLSLTYLILAYAFYFQKQIPSETICPKDISKAAAILDETLVGCYCKDLGSNILSESSFCASWILLFLRSKALLISGSIVVIIINYFLKFLVQCILI